MTTTATHAAWTGTVNTAGHDIQGRRERYHRSKVPHRYRRVEATGSTHAADAEQRALWLACVARTFLEVFRGTSEAPPLNVADRKHVRVA
jgi:hypothetical protein